MSDCECDDPPECPAGIPAWVMTFADLMSLLMCFFVLLLSFSEMDVLKFKQLAGSMREAFGVQNKIQVKDIPKGTSVIAQEFSPGRPEPTPISELRQITEEAEQTSLDVECAEAGSVAAQEKGEKAPTFVLDKLKKLAEKQASEQAAEIAKVLGQAINDGNVEVEAESDKIIIRVKDQGSFESGSAELQPDFIPIMEKISEAIVEIPGSIEVEGNTDNIPINTRRFRSNWELSSARAVSVAHELLLDQRFDASKFKIIGNADAKPLESNDSDANRAINRRVEIIVSPEPKFDKSDVFDADGNLIEKEEVVMPDVDDEDAEYESEFVIPEEEQHPEWQSEGSKAFESLDFGEKGVEILDFQLDVGENEEPVLEETVIEFQNPVEEVEEILESFDEIDWGLPENGDSNPTDDETDDEG